MTEPTEAQRAEAEQLLWDAWLDKDDERDLWAEDHAVEIATAAMGLAHAEALIEASQDSAVMSALDTIEKGVASGLALADIIRSLRMHHDKRKIGEPAHD